jgi:hypothetical protein
MILQNMLMQKGFHAPEIGVVSFSIDDAAEYTDAEGASCPRNRSILCFHR